MTTNRPLRVFLCHSKNDIKIVRELYEKLRAEPWIDPWLDEENLYPGQDWNLEIEKAIEETDVILVCLSNNSITKEGYVQREIRIALDYADYKPEGTLFIIPVRLEECTPPKRLARWQYADYFEGQRERGLKRVLVSLKRRADSFGLNHEQLMPSTRKMPIYDRSLSVEEATPKNRFEEVYARARKDISEKYERIQKDISGKVTNERSLSSQTEYPISKWIDSDKLTLSNGMEFMRVPAGKFLMGSTKENKIAYEDERPQNEVDISYDYWMARFPITNQQFNEFMIFKKTKHIVDGWESKKDHPVVWVSWDMALEYCQWLCNVFQPDEFPSGLIIRLPIEAEWEKAARWMPPQDKKQEGISQEYTWGEAFDKHKCNSSESGKGGTTPVDFYSPQGSSFLGCEDMLGNVWEWTNSVWKSYPYDVNDGREKQLKDITRVVRGGAFDNISRLTRCASRIRFSSTDGWSNLGFRVCLAPPLPK